MAPPPLFSPHYVFFFFLLWGPLRTDNGGVLLEGGETSLFSGTKSAISRFLGPPPSWLLQGAFLMRVVFSLPQILRKKTSVLSLELSFPFLIASFLFYPCSANCAFFFSFFRRRA